MDEQNVSWGQGVATFGASPRKPVPVNASLKEKLKPWVKERVLAWRMGMSGPQAAGHWLRAWVSHKMDGAPRPLRILVIGDGLAYTSDQQFAPMSRHIDALRREFGHVFLFRLIDDVLKDEDAGFTDFDAVIYKMSFETDARRAAAIARHFRRRAVTSQIPLIYFDGDDDQCVQWQSVIDSVDVYVKKHGFSERSNYQRDYVGRSNLTDYAARTHGVDFSRDHVPQARSLPARDVAKIRIGWNIALDDKIARLADDLAARGMPDQRDIDVMCRASSTKPGTLLYTVRNPAAAAIEALGNQFKVLAPTQHVGQAEYYGEMLRSKMCVCPFGYGELCWRDFEAALCGCLILKPNTGHVETAPALFVANQTYVPVAWDYSDLREKVAYYLDHPDEMQRIATAGQRAVQEALTQPWFINRYRQVVASALKA
jgi:hypothetical protein